MTKPKEDQSCSRCGIKKKRPGTTRICDQCYGTCRDCGKPAMKTGIYFTAYCYACRPLQKKCCKCGEPRDGSHQSYCTSCFNAYDKQWGLDNPEKKAAKERVWRERNPKKLEHKERRRTLKRFYGITMDDYDLILNSQGGVCAICERTGREAGGKGATLHVDHDHATGKVRALLCHGCNVGLGCAADDPGRLRKMADYVESHRHCSKLPSCRCPECLAYDESSPL